ncbi:hypothetical protein HanPSC8_Chr04g0161041 [Helianthus annuus]|nr:hypothetical protein HanPSC8_Chr04g0161041 [Helianthus annuus]
MTWGRYLCRWELNTMCHCHLLEDDPSKMRSKFYLSTFHNL